MLSGKKNGTVKFEENYTRWFQRCVLFAKSYVCDKSAAESLAAEAMSVYWEQRAAGEDIGMPLQFLLAIVRNKALHYLRSESLRLSIRGEIGELVRDELQFRIDTLESCDPHVLFEDDVQKILRETLDSLGGKTDRIFSLSRFEGMTNSEIAEELGIAEKTVEYHISRALKALRLSLKDYLPLIGIFLGL